MTHEQFENFASKLREERIIQATVIPQETIEGEKK
jgi:hypothetical protein